MIVADLGGPVEIDNLDMATAERDGDLLRVPKLAVGAALARYG